MVVESNQNVFLIQIDTSSFAEFEIPEFEIARVDCNANTAIIFNQFTLSQTFMDIRTCCLLSDGD